MFFLKDRWGQWCIDVAGEEDCSYSAAELHQLVTEDVLEPQAWLRHLYTRRYSLVAEVLFANGLISQETFDEWLPKPVGRFPMSA